MGKIDNSPGASTGEGQSVTNGSATPAQQAEYKERARQDALHMHQRWDLGDQIARVIDGWLEENPQCELQDILGALEMVAAQIPAHPRFADPEEEIEYR